MFFSPAPGEIQGKSVSQRKSVSQLWFIALLLIAPFLFPG